jgi:hypothetical protein
MTKNQQRTKRSSKPRYSDKNKYFLKNKKGQLGLGSIMQSIGNFFQGLMHLIPKPALFLIFIFIIVLLAQLLTYIFNIFGVYCTSGDIPVTIGFNPLQTAELIGEQPRAEDLGKEILEPNDLQESVIECTTQATGTGEYTLIYSNGTRVNSSVVRWFYHDGGCTLCDVSVKVDFHDRLANEQWCITDGHTKPEAQKNTLEKWFCGNKMFGRCEPPPHYYWDAQTGKYLCEDQTCAGITAGNYWDDTLAKHGAKPLYPDAYGEGISTSYDKAVSIQCHDVRPKLTLFGIDIFYFQYWIIGMLIIIMIWALKTWL